MYTRILDEYTSEFTSPKPYAEPNGITCSNIPQAFRCFLITDKLFDRLTSATAY